MLKNIFEAVLFPLICLSVGFAGSIFTASSVKTWYPTLTKPAFNPPDWIFGPAWTFLYITMGIAAYLVWKKLNLNINAKRVLIVFFIQLFLNLLWSPAFFGLKSTIAGLVIIIPLLIMIIYTMTCFFKINKTAGFLFIPYLLWVSFATILNITLVILN